jgi:hypothetical protein
MKQPGKAKKEWNSTEVNYANVTLSQADKVSFDAWLENAGQDFEQWFLALVDDSYRVSLKFDYGNNCYMATLTQQDAKHVNSGLTIISRGSNAIEAILMSAYKVFVLFEGQRLPVQDRDNTWG